LRPMSFGLDMMSVERKHHPGGQVSRPVTITVAPAASNSRNTACV
jgi:hypothetical protein